MRWIRAVEVVGGVLSTPVTTLVRPAMFGSIRGATFGLIVGMRVSMLRFGVRMMLCAKAAGVSRYANGTAAMTSAVATCLLFIRLMTQPSSMGPRLVEKR